MIRYLILDLDGPILDGRFRHYACYRSILEEHGYLPVSPERYWEMKREGTTLRQQLVLSGAEGIESLFWQTWLERIERQDLLALDRLQLGVPGKLQEWREQGVRLVLATLRRHPERLHNQLVHFGMNALWHRVVVADPMQGNTGKAEEVRQTIADLSPVHCLWVGDTEADVEAARILGCRVWAVTCGLRNEAFLAGLLPDFLSADLIDVDLECCHEH